MCPDCVERREVVKARARKHKARQQARYETLVAECRKAKPA